MIKNPEIVFFNNVHIMMDGKQLIRFDINMKSIEEQYKNIKTDYGQKISTQARNKLQKYLNVLRQMHKLQLIKPTQQKNNEDKILISIRNQFCKLRMEIQGELKTNLTDYQAYLWKLQKIVHRDKPPIFNHLKIAEQTNTEISSQNIKKNINFPILSCKVKELIKVSIELLMQNKYCSQNHSLQMITKLINQISNNYNILPYHNFTHAFSVFIMVVQCQHLSEGISKVFNQFQLFIMYIAALCHDLNHPGTNSFYEIKKKSNIAIIYNCESVLENMHISKFYRLCKENPDIDIISRIKSPVQRQTAKRMINRLILATDVQNHSKNLKKLQTLPKRQFTQYSTTQKQIMQQTLFHAYDVSNPCLNFDNYLNWSILICEQFNIQVDKQRKQLLEVSPNIQFVDMATHYRRQIGFINFLVLPIWRQLSNKFSELELLRKQIQNNLKQLQKASTQST